MRYEPKDSVIIDFTIFGSDYSNITQFYSLIDSIYNQISNKRLTIVFNSKSYILNLSMLNGYVLLIFKTIAKYIKRTT